MTETATTRPTGPRRPAPTASVRRVVVWLTIGSFGIAALMGILALLGQGALGEREGQVLLTTLVVGCTSVAMLCYLATAGTRVQWVGAAGGVVVLLPATIALLLIWNEGVWDTETTLKTFGIGLVVAATLAQLSLLLGVAAERRRLQLVLWPTVALAVGLAGLVVAMILAEPEADGVYRVLGILAILDVLGTITTLALAVFGNRAAGEPGAPVRIPATLEAGLTAAAQHDGRSRDDVVAEALEEWLARSR